MSNPRLATAHDWLVNDQYPHGEWGRCESNDPTADIRSFQTSRIKPNLFISSQAALALKATGYHDDSITSRFFDWLAKIRDPVSGFWTNASGAQVPMGGTRGWSEVKNVRHTAKALDLYLLQGSFTAGDAPVLNELLDCQQLDGSFPQHPSGASDLWSTAYAINLLIRISHQDHIAKAVPRGRTTEDWAVDLRNRNDRARAWLCSQVTDSLWKLPDRDPVWITEAVLAEVGADLALHRRDVASQVAKKVWQTGKTSRRGQTLWAMLLVFDVLDTQVRAEVVAELAKWETFDLVPNTYDMACAVRAFWLKDSPEFTKELVDISSGHESLMREWSEWSKAADGSSQSVDFAVIAIRDDEFAAVLKHFNPVTEWRGARRTYQIATVRSMTGAEYRVALLRAHEQGHSAAQSAATDVIVDLDPSWLLLVGIGGAVPEFEFSLGDVVVASRIADFSITAALANGATEYAAHGGPAHKAVQDLAARLVPLGAKLGEWSASERLGLQRPTVALSADRFVGDAQWIEKVRGALAYNFGTTGVEIQRVPVVTSATIGSANKLVKDPAMLQQWLTFARDLKAVEMELPGVYEAARDQAGDRPVLAIRGISDVVGYKRSPEWTAYACATAASFAHALIAADAIPLKK